MPQSMTGFGSAENDGFRVEIRSLNHRFIDITIKMPPYLSHYEIPFRNILKERFRRGRLDVSILADDTQLTEFTINKEMARKIYHSFLELQRKLSIPGELEIGTLAGYKGLIIEGEPKYDIDALYAAFHEAVSHLETMRMREGALLLEELRQRVDSLNEMNKRLQSLTPQAIEKCKERFSERIGFILEGEEVDRARILQEAAIMAEKLDISEEVSRIEKHIQQFIETLKEENAVGRKLDFLLQEINREVNTIAAKSSDYTVSSLIVDMKIEVEKMREQVQNIQ